MTAFVNTGDSTGVLGKVKGGKRCHHRYGGETAYRQHQGDEKREKIETALARRRSADVCFASEEGDYHALGDEPRDVPGDYCPCTGVTPVLDGIVREGNIELHYVDGKLMSAHCR